MAPRKNPERPVLSDGQEGAEAPWLPWLDTDQPIGTIAGPGRWLVATYLPTALFSLKDSKATSSVGKTLLVPTPYAIKMALVDVAFRSGLPDEECAQLVSSLTKVEVRIAPPSAAVVTHTFVKIRQEPKTRDVLHPYTSSIAYREVVHYQGLWQWAFDLAIVGPVIGERIAFLAPRVNYIGKRGSFVQFVGMDRAVELSSDYTLPLPPTGDWLEPPKWHPATLDDFGAEASLEVLSSYSSVKAVVPKHRRYINSLVPLGVTSNGPGFTEYRAQD
jgi:hypothetical protein